jgi:uncharacterized membrane protein YqiK
MSANAETVSQEIRQRPLVQRIDSESDMLAERTRGYAIVDAAGYENAAADLRTIKTLTDAVESERFAITRPMDAAKAAVMSFFKPFSDRLAAADRAVRTEMGRFKAEQERKEREARRAAEEKANRERAELERKAREERAAAEAKAREERAEAERLEKEGKARAAAELRASAAATVEKAEVKAEKLLDRAADVVAAPPPPSAAPKVKGVTDRKVWKYEITNKALVPDEFYDIVEKRIADRVKSLKGDTRIPGVRVWSEDDVSVRR